RRAVPGVHHPGTAAGGPDRPVGRHPNYNSLSDLRDAHPASSSHAPNDLRRGCARLVRFDVSHSQTNRLGVAQMTDIRRQTSVVSVLLLLAGVRVGAQTSLSIYSDGRVVVRKMISQKLQKGTNIFSLDLPGLDPATLFSPDSNVAVTSAVLRPATDMESALRASIGRTLSFVVGKGDTVQATVLSVSPPQTKLSNGMVMFSFPNGTPLFPAEASLIRSKPEAVVTLDANRARDVTDLAYVSQGVTWEAVYQAVLSGSGSALVTGAATINSSSLKADSVYVQLVACSVTLVDRAQSVSAGFAVADRMAIQKNAGEEASVTEG